MEPGRGLLRIVRGGLLGGLCVLLSLSGHLLGGGAAPAAASALVASALIGAAAIAWAGRRREFRELLAAAAAAQAAFHTVLSLSPPHGHSGLTVRMVALHAVATVAMAAVLAHGEAVLDACTRAVRSLRLPAVPVLNSDRPLALPRSAPRVVVATSVLQAATRPRRGPPVVAAA